MQGVKIVACSVENFQFKVRNCFPNGKMSLQRSRQRYETHDTLNKTVERAAGGISETVVDISKVARLLRLT